MGREKKNPPQAVAGGAKEQRQRRINKSQYDPKAPMPVGFVAAKPVTSQAKSKHHTYLEFVENKDKKKKLEFKATTDPTPPPGFEFVPIGNPALTNACKELSREKDAMIFIVSNSKEVDPNHLSHHVHRTGHHIREAIVEEARTELEHLPASGSNGKPEPLPATQEVYTAQANSAILDLFPRIPNTDRQSIISHAFNLASVNQRPKPVGLSTDMPLSRRVQLAVLAHIRHTHTRYDDLLKETSWQNARKVVESLCLDILVKWRGDEETGRDQLDEILREVVVISDSDSEESDSEDDEPMEGFNGVLLEEAARPRQDAKGLPQNQGASTQNRPLGSNVPVPISTAAAPAPQQRPPAKKEQRGFKRYRAWEEAIQRNREDELHPVAPAMAASVSRGSHHFHGSPAPGPRPAASLAGIVPDANGFVSRQPRSLAPSAMPLSNYAARPHDQVNSGFREQARTTPGRSRNVTPVADQFQDMLVRSIEPASPETTMPPAFVRTLPPRSHLPPTRRGVPYRPESASPARDVGTSDKPFYVERRVVSDRPEHPALPRYRGEPLGHLSGPRYADSRPMFQSPLSAVEPRLPPSGGPPVPAHKIAVGHPSDRGNPIRMEDRGGFFEVVHHQPNNTYSHQPHPNADSGRWPPHPVSRAPEPHRVVSWEEGSRILHESRNDRNVEVIPVSGPRALPPAQEHHGMRMDYVPDTRPYDPWAPRDQPGAPYQHQPLPSRPEYMAAPAARQEVTFGHQPPGGPWHPPPHQQVYPHQQQHDQQRPADPYARPEHRYPPHGGGNVILLE